MTPPEFVEGLAAHARDSAVTEVLELLRSPPGRRPAAELLALSQWYRALAPEDRDKVQQLAALSAHHCLFGTLCILDGSRPAFPGGPVRFDLAATQASAPLAIAPGDTFLHDLLPPLPVRPMP